MLLYCLNSSSLSRCREDSFWFGGEAIMKLFYLCCENYVFGDFCICLRFCAFEILLVGIRCTNSNPILPHFAHLTQPQSYDSISTITPSQQQFIIGIRCPSNNNMIFYWWSIVRLGKWWSHSHIPKYYYCWSVAYWIINRVMGTVCVTKQGKIIFFMKL